MRADVFHSQGEIMRLKVLVAAMSAGLAVAACGGGSSSAEQIRNFVMENISPASTDAEMRQVRASATATVDGQDASTGYVTILRSGQQVGSDANLNVFGQIVDNQMKPILKADASQPIADSNDFSSILPVGGKLFTVSHFESYPGALYLTEMNQDATTGQLSAKSTRALDLSGINGIWDPCAGSVTPWNTHLGSEEYEPDASKAGSADVMAPFFGGGTTLGGDVSKVNPYYWGFPVEVAVTDFDHASVTKHYSMGRMAHELSYVMPDLKTVYQSDDGTNVGLFMYVADMAGDLTAGTLYAMKFSQTSSAGSTDLPGGNVSWIKLGHATDNEVHNLIVAGIAFAQIFAATAPNADGTCATGFKSVNANGVGEECLMLKPGMEQAAAFLESRRYAGYLGATTELRKEEGMSFDPDGKRFYVAYSEIQYGMEDNKKNNTANTTYDIGTGNDVKALFNSCGGVYAYTTGSDATIGSDYVLKTLDGSAGIAGHMTTLADAAKANPSTIDAYAAGSPYEGSTCDINGLANPDNVSFVKGRKTLLIGEDTGDGHRNDMVWAYNIETRELTRVLTTPYGSETTSVYNYPDVNGFGYIMAVVQHPYGESDQDKALADADKRSYFGYIGTLPKQQ
jgi:secreted PhoX family phosphatase